jgi:hypothetical protein
LELASKFVKWAARWKKKIKSIMKQRNQAIRDQEMDRAIWQI